MQTTHLPRAIVALCSLIATVSLLGQGSNGSPKPGDVKVNPKDKQRYVWVPPGTFRQGCSQGDKECIEDEYPVRNVTLESHWRGFSLVAH